LIRRKWKLRERHHFKIKPSITPGVGKTHVAQALGHLAIRHGADVRFIKTSRALADLAGGRADHTWERRLHALARPNVPILDDFAMRELTPPQADDLYELIGERAGRSLILHRIEQNHGQDLGNYLSTAPGELRGVRQPSAPRRC
jgi:hypothetical protein